MPDVKVLKFDVGSITDQALISVQNKLSASSGVEAVRRSLTLTDKLTDLAKNGSLYVKDEHGNLKELQIL